MARSLGAAEATTNQAQPGPGREPAAPEGGGRPGSSEGSSDATRPWLRERLALPGKSFGEGGADAGTRSRAVGGARAAALGAPTPGSSSRLRSKHGGGSVRGPSGETESGSYAERERRAGLRRRRHCRETTPRVSAPAAAAAPRAGSAAEVERDRSGTRGRGARVATSLRPRAA